MQNFLEFFIILSDANHKGSSNSQDSFQQAQIQSPPGSSSTSMDSYNSYPPPSQIQQPPIQQQIPPPQQQTQQPTGSNAPNVPSPNVPQSEFNVNFALI